MDSSKYTLAQNGSTALSDTGAAHIVVLRERERTLRTQAATMGWWRQKEAIRKADELRHELRFKMHEGLRPAVSRKASNTFAAGR